MSKKRPIYLLGLLACMFLLVNGLVHAATMTVTVDNTQGWQIIPDGDVTIEWAEGVASVGVGSLQFGPISGANPANKFIMSPPYANQLASEFVSLSYDYYIHPTSSVGNAHFYTNMYVDSSANGIGTFATWYDCRYDYTPVDNVFGAWNTGSRTMTDTWGNVANPIGSCTPTIGDLPAGSVIMFVAINGGQSTATDDGLRGGFDNIVITTTAGTNTYDFESGTQAVVVDDTLPITVPVLPPSPGLNDWNATHDEDRGHAWGTDDSVYGTVHMQNGAWQYNAGGIPQDLIDYGVIMAIDVWEQGGDQFFDNYERVCLLGEGRLIYFDATQSPRPMVEIPVDFENGYTCGWIPNAGMLVLINQDE